MIDKLIKIFAALCFITGFSFAGSYERPGSTSGQFLKIGVSARAVSMGEAYVAVTDGAEAFFYNPACLARIQGIDMFFSHCSWFSIFNHDVVAIAKNVERIGAFGLSVTTFLSNEMRVTTPLQPDGNGETFYVGNYRAGLSYARFLNDRAALGLNINYLYLQMWTYKVHSWSGDIGVFFRTDFHGFRFGMSIVNFGTNIKFISENYALPISFSFGAAIEPIKNDLNTLTIAFTTIKATDAEQKLKIGSELWFRDFVAFRMGYKFNYDVESYSLGAGIKVNMGGHILHIDYAYADYDLLSEINRFSVSYKF